MSDNNSRKLSEFQKLFGEFQKGEVLIESTNSFDTFLAYSCALQREILAQGRMFVTTNRLAFHANIIGWVTNVFLD